MPQQGQFQETQEPPQGLSSPVIIIPKKYISLSTEFLNAADIKDFIELQSALRPFLKRPYHLKERTEDDLHLHLSEGMPLIGVKTSDGKKLAGGCLLSFLSNEEGLKHLSGYPVSDAAKPVTAIVQSLCVSHNYREMGVARLVLDAAFQTAAEKGMTQILCAIADDNQESSRAFRNAGYVPFDHGYDAVKRYAKTFYRVGIGCTAASSDMALIPQMA